MKKLFLLILFVFTGADAQELSVPVKLLTDNEAAADRYAGRDQFGWHYTIANNEFRKQKDGVIVRYKAVSLGTIYRVDLQNPLQIVLFYKKFNTVVMLDNQLNETARFDFNEIVPQNRQLPIVAEAVGLASQNRLWLYDMNTQQAGLYDPAARTFKSVTPPFNQQLKTYYSDYNYFYWADDSLNFYAVNLFGKVTHIGTLPEFDRMQPVSATQVILQKGNALYLYSFGENSLQKVGTVEKTITDFFYTAQILTIFTGTHITEYNITLPE
ncbi:hypothetical protein [Flavobacterium sp.]|uniref:hypothetical protein n=1 Tax=Flavobacterium sp. TaxID=239 RepID=UPI00261FD6B7|nr:hypothetical protein [Flavobacterium sp.]